MERTLPEGKPMEERTCKEVMIKLGECIDRMVQRGYPEKESWLCMKIANSLYLMCLNLQRIEEIEQDGDRSQARLYFTQALQALYKTCAHYAETSEETIADGVFEGMKALHSFERAKQTFQTYLQKSHADSESSTSKSD